MSRLRIVPLFGLVVCLSGLAAVGPVATAGPPVSRVEQKQAVHATPKQGLSDQHLQRVAERSAMGRQVNPSVARIVAGRVRVEVVGTTPASTRRAVRAAGGAVVGRIRTLVLADVPMAQLQRLEDSAGILYVRLPQRVDEPAGLEPTRSTPPRLTKTGSLGQEAVTKTGVGAWHAAGFTGAGVKIGVIDGFLLSKWQAAMSAGEIPAMPAGTFCRANGVDCAAQFWNGGDHGVGVSEVLYDMAPGVTLYLASANTTTDMRAAVDYFASQGVRIISRSQTASYDGPGNGTGPIADVQAYAVGKGIAWINSAGNSAGAGSDEGTYFRQTWADPNNNGWMDFGTTGNEYLAFTCNGRLINGLRWSDWAPIGRTDYDIEVYEEESDTTKISQGTADQAAGAPPLETGMTCTSGTDLDYMSVKLFAPGSGAAGDMLEFMTNDAGVELWSNPYSVTGPAADTNTPGTASIGAVDPPSGANIASYSAQGPTNDQRIKPDLSAAAGMTNLTLGTFGGTSAATPVVAGVAAVLLGTNPALTPAQLIDALRSAVVDRGPAGPDNVYGTGELTLPAPAVAAPVPVASQVSVRNGYVVPILRSLKDNFPVQVRWKVDGTQSSATVWRSLNKGNFLQGAATGSKKRVRVKMVLGKSNQYAIRAADPAGALSDWYYTRLYHPRVIDDKDFKVKYARGWRHGKLRGAWKHTYSTSAGSHGSARLRFKGSSVSLVMFRSPNSGKVKVYLDGKAIGKINLHSNKVQTKRVVANLYYRQRGRHVIELEPLTTAPVFLDGFLVMG